MIQHWKLKCKQNTKNLRGKRLAEQMEFAYGIFVFAFQVQYCSGVHLHVLSVFNRNRMNSAVAVAVRVHINIQAKNGILHVLMKYMRPQLWEFCSSRICKPCPICGEEFMGNRIRHSTYILCLLWPFCSSQHTKPCNCYGLGHFVRDDETFRPLYVNTFANFSPNLNAINIR